jgi:uncharacterized protein (TIGR00297 family)
VRWIGGSFLDSGGLAPPLLLLSGCAAAAVAAALAESVDSGIDDNLLVPVVGGAALYAATLVEPARLAAARGDMLHDLVVGAAVNGVLALAAWGARAVAPSGAVAGWIVGTALFALGGWPLFAVLLAFFLLGSAATRLGFARKASLGIAQERGGRRGAGHALANTSAAVLLAFLAVSTPHHAAFSLAAAAAFATAACDTVSSEVGQAYGRRHYLVTTFRRVAAGTDGAVSLEGTLAGVAAAAVVAAVAYAGGVVSAGGAGVAVLAAFAGSTLESYLGATIERAGRIGNHLMNFANTIAGALVALLAGALA